MHCKYWSYFHHEQSKNHLGDITQGTSVMVFPDQIAGEQMYIKLKQTLQRVAQIKKMSNKTTVCLSVRVSFSLGIQPLLFLLCDPSDTRLQLLLTSKMNSISNSLQEMSRHQYEIGNVDTISAEQFLTLSSTQTDFFRLPSSCCTSHSKEFPFMYRF